MLNKLTNSFLLIFIFTILIFALSLQLRSPWFGKLVEGDHHYLTASTIKFTQNWYYETPWKLLFAMWENPPSVEFPNLLTRELYISYPPGTLLFVYLASILLYKEPSASIVMAINLTEHFFIALTVGLIAYLLWKKYTKSNFWACLFSLVPIVLEIFLPASFYFHQNVYFSDQAVILPYILTLLFELLIDFDEGKKYTKALKFIQTLIIVYGVLTDWLILFLLFFIFVKRLLINKLNPKQIIIYWIVPAIPIILFLIQVFLLHGFPLLCNRFLVRTNINSPDAELVFKFFSVFWWDYFRFNFADSGVWMIWLSGWSMFAMLLSSFRRMIKNREFIYLFIFLIILIFPPLVQIYVFKDHSVVHNFSVLKFSPVIALIPFSLLPLLFIQFLKKFGNENNNNGIFFIIFLLINLLHLIYLYKNINREDFDFLFHAYFYNIGMFMVVPLVFGIIDNFKLRLTLIFLAYLLFFINYYKELLPLRYRYFQKSNKDIVQIAQSIRNCSNYNDVIFSFDYEIPKNPPQKLALSRKRIYKIDTFKDINQHVKNVKEQYKILLFNKQPWSTEVVRIFSKYGEYSTCSGFSYFITNLDMVQQLVDKGINDISYRPEIHSILQTGQSKPMQQ